MQKKYRYPGTEPFKVEDKDLFFGREQDTAQLYQLIKLEQMVVLHGKSGYGKTSLLRAGILPKLEEESSYRSRYIRVGRYFEDNNSLKQLFLTQVFGDSLPKSNLLEQLLPEDDTLWEFFKSAQLESENSDSFLLLLDQFEEFFSYPLEHQEEFFSELADLLFVKVPTPCKNAIHAKMDENADFFSGDTLSKIYKPLDIKVVFSIRSDKLSFVDELKPYVPNVLQNTYILDALSSQQAADAILLPSQLAGEFSSPTFEITEDSKFHIINYLADKRTKRIEAFQLQMICQYIELYVVIEDGNRVIEPSLLGNLENIVENFYDKQIEKLGDEKTQNLARAVMGKLIFEEDLQRLQLYEKQLLREISISVDLLTKMEEARLIRAEISSLGTRTYEITHDTLVVAAVKSKNRRQQQQIESAKEAQAKLQKKVNEFEQKWSDDIERLNTEIASFEKKSSKGWNNVLKAFSADNTQKVAQKYLERGDLYYNLANYEQAIQDYKKCLELDPTSVLASLRLGNCFYTSKQYEQALIHYNKTIELDPTSEWAYRNRGLVKQSQKRYEEALKDYKKAIELNPAYASPYNDMGIIYETLKDYKLAIQHYEKAKEVDPNYALYYLNAGNMYRKTGALEQAESVLLVGLKLDPYNKGINNSLGNVFLDQGHYEDALDRYNKAIELDPNEAIYYRNRGLANKQIAGAEAALLDYQKAIQINPNYSDPHNDIGVIYDTQKEYEKAIESYNKAITLDHNNAMYYRNRALAYQGLGRIKEAEQDFKKTIEIDENYAVAYNDIGLIHYDQKEYDIAIDYYSKAIALDPNNIMYYRNRALAYQDLGWIKEAEQDFRKTIEIDEHYAVAYNDIGLIYYYKKEYDDAILYFKEAINLDSSSQYYYQNLGSAYKDKGDLEKAIIAYQDGITVYPSSDNLYILLGNSYLDNYQYDEAIAAYDKVLSLSKQQKAQPENESYAYYNKGIIYQTLTEYRKALYHYQQASILNPQFIDAEVQIGFMYAALDEHDLALQHINEGIKSAKQVPAWYFATRAWAYKNARQYDLAIQDVEKSLELEPQSAFCINTKGCIFYDQGKYEQAEEYFKKALKISPKDENFTTNLSETYVSLGKLEQAETELKWLLEAYPEDGFKRFVLAKLKLQKGDEAGFFEELHRALDIKYPHYFHDNLEREPFLKAYQNDPRMQVILKQSQEMWEEKLNKTI